MSVEPASDRRDETIAQLESEVAELRALVEGAPHAILRWSDHRGSLWASPSFEDVTGLDPRDLPSDVDGLIELAHPDFHARLRAAFASCDRWQLTIRPRQGSDAGREPGWLDVLGSPVEVKGEWEWHLRIYNVTESKRARLKLAASEARWRAAFDHGPVGLALLDAGGCVTAANRTLVELLGRDPRGEAAAEMVGSRDRRALARAMAEVAEDVDAEAGLRARIPVPVTSRGGRDSRWVDMTVAAVHADIGDSKSSDRFILTVIDVDERVRAEQSLRFQADHDQLSELPNRRSITRHLRQALSRASRHGHRVAVAFIDLDGFKGANDSLGHAAGDRILATAAERLRSTLREGDVVGRFGGDEFVLVAEHVNQAPEARALAERVTEALKMNLTVAGRTVVVTGSVGVAISVPGQDASHLLRDADAAMYRAKQRGRARWEFFDERMASYAVDRFTLEQDLRSALARDEFGIAVQSIVELSTGAAVGREALLRMFHPRRGTVMPGEFLELAEATSLIVPIGSRVLDLAVSALSAEPESGWISVNVSGRQLVEPGLADEVKALLGTHGIDPARLLLEVTETALVESENAVPELERLAEIGVPLALDDFGTGYSSLTRLRGLPVSVLKLDRSFVSGIRHDPSAEAVIASVIDLGHALDMKVIAEGVESEGQAETLRELGCDGAQGFYYSQPSVWPDRLTL